MGLFYASWHLWLLSKSKNSSVGASTKQQVPADAAERDLKYRKSVQDNRERAVPHSLTDIS